MKGAFLKAVRALLAYGLMTWCETHGSVEECEHENCPSCCVQCKSS